MQHPTGGPKRARMSALGTSSPRQLLSLHIASCKPIREGQMKQPFTAVFWNYLDTWMQTGAHVLIHLAITTRLKI